MANARVEIDRDYTGPVNSSQGGIAAGMLARHIPGPAEVRLHAPPPLATPLEVEQDSDGRLKARQGDTTIMSARPTIALDLPLPTTDIARVRQPPHFPEGHLARQCVVCGDEHPRSLQVWPGPVQGVASLACEWMAPDWAADGDGHVRPEILWGVLDCPGGWAIHQLGGVGEDAFAALGTMTGTIHAPVPVGRPVVVMGWPLDHEGRKHRAGVCILGLDGTVHAIARQTCVAMPADFGS